MAERHKFDISSFCEINFYYLNTRLGSLMPFPVRLLHFELLINSLYAQRHTCAPRNFLPSHLPGRYLSPHGLPSPQELEGRKDGPLGNEN